MPAYDCECQMCHTRQEIVRTIAERDNTPECCGLPMRRLVTINFHVHGDLEPYLDENLGHDPVWVKSKKHREQLCKERGLIIKSPKGEY